jgi:uncharacterized DUF497 family protein
MTIVFAGVDWDEDNREKCLKHGVSFGEIEALFSGPIAIRPDLAHSTSETRFLGIGPTAAGRRELHTSHQRALYAPQGGRAL